MATWNINITVDGTTVWSMGPFENEEEATAFLGFNGHLVDDLSTHFAAEARQDALEAGEGNYFPVVDVTITCVNSPAIWLQEDDLDHEQDIVDFLSEIPQSISYWAALGQDSNDRRLIIASLDDQTDRIVITPASLAAWLKHDAARVVAHVQINDQIASAILRLAAGKWGDTDWDVETCDVVVQLMLFGQIIYG